MLLLTRVFSHRMNSSGIFFKESDAGSKIWGDLTKKKQFKIDNV